MADSYTYGDYEVLGPGADKEREDWTQVVLTGDEDWSGVDKPIVFSLSLELV